MINHEEVGVCNNNFVKNYGSIWIIQFSARQTGLCCIFYLLKILKNTHYEVSSDKIGQGFEFLKKNKDFPLYEAP